MCIRDSLFASDELSPVIKNSFGPVPYLKEAASLNQGIIAEGVKTTDQVRGSVGKDPLQDVDLFCPIDLVKDCLLYTSRCV